MKYNYVKNFNEFNESLKGKIATAALALGLAGCDPNTNNWTPPNINHSKSHEITKSNTSDTLTDKFDIEENLISIGTDFTISTGGIIEQRTLNLRTTFEYLQNDKVIASAEKSLLSWGVEIIIYDSKKEKIGSIEEEIIKSMFSIKTIYTIKDAKGTVLGTSKKLDFIGTDIDIYDQSGNIICTMTRPMINLLSDTWTVNIINNKIDKRILIFIPCYKTYADNERKDEKDKDDDN